MTGRRGRIAIAVAALGALLLGAVLLASPKPGPAPRPPGEQQPLMLLTTLPIIFAERLTLEAAGSPALEALQSRYRVVAMADDAESGRIAPSVDPDTLVGLLLGAYLGERLRHGEPRPGWRGRTVDLVLPAVRP